MTIRRKKDLESEKKITKQNGEEIEKKLSKKSTAKKKVKNNPGSNENWDVYDMSDPEQAKLADQEIKKKIQGTVKKTSKKSNTKTKTKSEKLVKKPVNQSKRQTEKKTAPKKDGKSTSQKEEKNASDSKNIQDIIDELPGWFIELFEYLDKLDGINVLSQDEEKEDHPKKRKTSFTPKEIERKLFLVFMASPKKHWNSAKMEYERILQKDFSIAANISENSLSEWKKQNWFKDNHALVMKEIFKARTPDVLNSLYEGATTGVNEFGKRDAAAIKLWLEYIEGFKPGMDVTSGGEKVEVYFGNGNVGKSQFINKNEKKGE